jgi:hypothetical protein
MKMKKPMHRSASDMKKPTIVALVYLKNCSIAYLIANMCKDMKKK